MPATPAVPLYSLIPSRRKCRSLKAQTSRLNKSIFHLLTGPWTNYLVPTLIIKTLSQTLTLLCSLCFNILCITWMLHYCTVLYCVVFIAIFIIPVYIVFSLWTSCVQGISRYPHAYDNTLVYTNTVDIRNCSCWNQEGSWPKTSAHSHPRCCLIRWVTLALCALI